MSRRRGFTLIELLVVIAIMAVLVGLLLPAVQQAREAARRSQCQNNLKQIGLALHNYADAHGGFPGTHFYATIDGHWRHNGWAVSILPYLDQAPLFEQYDLNHSFSDEENQDVVKTKLSVFLCPSTPGGQQLVSQLYNDDDWAFRPDLTAATGDYAASRGACRLPWRADMVPNPALPPPARNGCVEGPMIHRQRNHLADITDGTTNTICIIESAGGVPYGPNHEKRTDPGALDWFGYGNAWAGVRGNFVVGSEFDPTVSGGPHLFNMKNDGAEAYSFHQGGVHVLLCDGSARFVSEHTDRVVYSNLLTRELGEIVGEW